MAIFLTADTHLWHRNILLYERRPFKSIDEMGAVIRDNWNSVVSPDDIVFHLGDVSFGLAQDTIDYIQSLNGSKALIRGNHDFGRSKSFWHRCGFLYVHNKAVDFGSFILSHEPVRVDLLPDGVINFHGHIHSLARRIEWEDYNYSLWHINVGVDVCNFKPVKLF